MIQHGMGQASRLLTEVVVCGRITKNGGGRKVKIEKYYDNEYIFPFMAFIPDTAKENPALIIHLHGVGERGFGGDDLERVTVHGLPKVVNDGNLKNCIMVCPQCPSDTFWVARIESMRKYIDKIVEKYNVDKCRIYLCGLSMGGYGTWYTAEAYPDLFAAIAPCCGGGMVWYAPMMKMPIWAFHGREDDLVDVSETINMVEKLKKFDRNVKCDIFEGVGHNSWDFGFTPELIEWFLEQHK